MCPKCEQLMDVKCPTCGYIDADDPAKEVREQYKHQVVDEFLLT